MATQANSATDNELNSIEMKVKEVAEHCKQTGASNNPAEILRHLQTSLVCGRALEVTCQDNCPEGLTNFVMIDRQNLLRTAFEEIQSLENKLITLGVQFYNEVSLYFSRLGSSLFQEKSREKQTRNICSILNITCTNWHKNLLLSTHKPRLHRKSPTVNFGVLANVPSLSLPTFLIFSCLFS